jgi:hypothetical protein
MVMYPRSQESIKAHIPAFGPTFVDLSHTGDGLSRICAGAANTSGSAT